MTGIQDDLAMLAAYGEECEPFELALARVEAEIARLTDEQLVKYERGDDFHHDFWKERAGAAEAEVARLKDGLRTIALNVPAYQGEEWRGYIDEATKRRDIARALLADDGAAQSNVCPCGYDGDKPCNGCPGGCERRPAGVTGWDHIDNRRGGAA